MKFCLNLCEIIPGMYQIDTYQFLDEVISKTGKNEFPFDNLEKKELPDRIYLGSNFCSQYFLHQTFLPALKYASERRIPVTLTLPVFTQKDLKSAKKLISSILNKKIVDEITVNDPGMKNYLRHTHKKINLGRLFFKDPRDGRIGEYLDSVYTPMHMDFPEEADGIEIDPVARKLELKTDKVLGVHYPYCYQSTGNICKFASIGKPDTKRFRPNDKCSLPCQRIFESFISEETGRTIIRFGRTVYFENQEIEPENADRLIYFPLKEVSDYFS